MSEYRFEDIESRWQRRWSETRVFEVDVDVSRPKFYCLEMLPYPSGDIHVGHVRNYCITDVVARFKWMRGFNVLHPIGWDALGLPAENAAIKRGVHPEQWTRQNIAGMKRQLVRLGFSYPWSREVATCDTEYYRWNQWFFLKMLEKGVAYRSKAPVNWCPSCHTVLANEQAQGCECWRCHSAVEERELDQWFLRITDYQDQLLDDMRQLTAWPERVLLQQRNWIGRSEGAEIDFMVEGGAPLRIFTTRVDTIFGATFMAISPEHPRIEELIGGASGEACIRQDLARLRAQDRRARQAGEVEKEGVFTGRYAVNPYNGERIPIWAANFVLMGYGTGAIMSVPAHDQRDFEFARKYGLPVRVVIQPAGENLDGDMLAEAYEGTGVTSATGDFSGLRNDEAIRLMTEHAEKRGFGRAAVTYRLKDWLISRQRFWGTPIPVLYCEKDGMVPVSYDDLPVVLPKGAPFTGEGGNPLDKVPSFVEARCPRCGGRARRETDTMDTFIDSSWYFYRYLSPCKQDGPFDPEAVRYWFPIDLYVGGIEHAILHLVYARFWTKMMRDLGLVDFAEPVVRLFPQGMVHKEGEVMSKSRGNTVAPDEVIAEYGADTLRLYILSVAPPEMALEWSDESISGAQRLIHRVWRLVDRHIETIAAVSAFSASVDSQAERDLRRKTHQTIQRVTRDIEERMHLNTAVAAFSELVNEIQRLEDRLDSESGRVVLREAVESLVLLMNPYTPHLCEELWKRLGHQEDLVRHAWPVADPEIAREETIEMAVQVNGKVRGHIVVPQASGEEEIRQGALAEPKVRAHLEGQEVLRVVVVPGRLVSIASRRS
ncbi:MAG: leucine--tRNA ligase [Vicinamibacteria bacterium]|nr:leucine--tRNA ligase [Vicinamibacteria bacterium]